MSTLHTTLPDGVYIVSLHGESGTYRMEKRSGVWFFSDGTGWEEEMPYPEAILKADETNSLPLIQKDTIYKNTYPLSEFFPV